VKLSLATLEFISTGDEALADLVGSGQLESGQLSKFVVQKAAALTRGTHE